MGVGVGGVGGASQKSLPREGAAVISEPSLGGRVGVR